MPETEILSIPLFPLQAVLFPGGLLSLKVFEARYLDLISACMRENKPFGVVSLRQGTEVRKPGEAVAMEDIGTLAELIDVDSAQHGILQVRCRGTQRFEVQTRKQQADGLWQAQARLLAGDDASLPTDKLVETVRGLANAIATLKQQGSEPFLKPFKFDHAGWVSNRWCEILPISIAAKQKLMELPDPQVRLQLVDEFLRTKGVVK
ncbi:MAG: LON peptidase substrate-binding domain-containing protein [Cytophagales bacterium]|nr:LON peptidase substrate-binding domain-containing protein [Rhizobacter sp.]